MASRSIDFAKKASIDMMALNNKVVNMRQVVKKTKVHVISKLCKHITALKKKKGTDEQKAKNLRKAQRFIEEIDSIKKLKEDKVSKFALANTTSFSDTSKISLSPGPRALARLADHHLMKKVVSDFREQHSDWRDLAAYLLIKQTGRRFKTKKQKQKKLTKCVENIEASETMTKAYIQERFGHDGLVKAELRFERKRKRPKSGPRDRNNVDCNDDKKAKMSVQDPLASDEHGEDDVVTNTEHVVLEGRNNVVVNQVEVVEDVITGQSELSSGSEEGGNEFEALSESQSDGCKKNIIQKQHDDSEDSSSSVESDTDQLKEPFSKSNIQIAKCDSLDVETTKVISVDTARPSRECVVRELRLEGSISGDDSSHSEVTDDESEQDSQSNSDNDKQNVKLKAKKTKATPELLTQASKIQPSDPFFAGSDDDDDVEDSFSADMYNSDEDVAGDDSTSGRLKTKSMFYQPSGQGSSKWSQSGRGRSGGFERRGPPGRFDKGQRGRTFGGDGGQRGRTFRSDGRGAGGERKSLSQTSSNKLGGKVTAKQGTASRFNRDNVVEQKNGHTNSAQKEKLHPSWEASKKRKAEQSSLLAFKGSKITFDDDD